MGQVHRKATTLLQRSHDLAALLRIDLPRAAAPLAVQVSVLRCRQDVELFASIGTVAVANQAHLVEDVHRPVDGGGDGRRIHLAAALDQLRRGDVAVGAGKDLHKGATLRRPAQAARPEQVTDVIEPELRDRVGWHVPEYIAPLPYCDDLQ